MTSSGTQTARTIAGYTLLERIGAGGYGEVWKAEAPGGLVKAVKLIYGHLGDERADCEQKALQRIKEARHPFLLSIERIEVVDCQLVIVTELAEASFKDRFDECRRSGMSGIPREELLTYLHDVADALDYISEHHSLQHLDVKPENLLLLSGHAKVGDFGLVKHVEDRAISLMGGLTPVYAAPEIFDGRPSLHSDQYSLAIVYQEMLTGVLPFPGRTPAQLAVQHASAEPRLGPLDPAEQETIARALSKTPQQRFPNCRAMVSSLAERSRSDVGRKQTSVSASDPAPVDTVTTPVDCDGTTPKPRPAAPVVTVAMDRGSSEAVPGAQSSAGPAVEAFEAAPEVVDLPPLEVSPDQHRLQPILVLGIGGTGARVLRRLQERLHDRYGDVAIPAMRMLLLDTDRSELAAATCGDPRTALSPEATLALPLRRSQQYRSDARKHLAWLSRRWLYNIPRSLKTRGLRPLGRLALVDHETVVLERLRRDLAAATEPEALAASAEATGIAAGDGTPRVYLVASISGGTGSGMVLDLAAMVRKTLGELGLSDACLLGMLTHSTGRRPEEHDLAVLNAYASLSELHHYDRTGSSPGDAACNLSATNRSPPTFRHAYLVPLGERLDEQQLDTATDAIAQYLYLDAVTPAGVFFDAHREAGKDANGDSADSVNLRTFGLTQIGCPFAQLPSSAAEVVCRQVVARWQGDKSAANSETERAAEQLAEVLQLNLHAFVAQALEVVRRELGGGSEAAFRGKVAKHADPEPTIWALLQHTLDELPITRDAESNLDDVSDNLATALVRSLGETASKQGAAVVDWIHQWANDSSAGAAGAQRGTAWFTDRVRSLEAELRQSLGTVQEQMAPSDDHSSPSCRLRLSRVVLDHVGKALHAVRQQTVAAGDRLNQLSHALNLLADQFPEHGRLEQLAAEEDAGTPGAEDLQKPLACKLNRQIDRLADEVDRKLRTGPLAEHGLWGLLDQQHDLFQHVTDVLRTHSRATVLQTLRQLSAARLMLGSDDGHPEATNQLGAALEGAEPALTTCGGTRRLLVVTPDGELTRLPTNSPVPTSRTPSVVIDADVDLTFCYEMARLSVRRAAAMLIDGRPDYEMIASRLHTRIDVDWTHFDRPCGVDLTRIGR